MSRADWIGTVEPVLETTMSVDDTIAYLRYRGDSSGVVNLQPSEAAELVQYIDQLRAVNLTFATELVK
jgi:hypothetical protein